MICKQQCNERVYYFVVFKNVICTVLSWKWIVKKLLDKDSIKNCLHAVIKTENCFSAGFNKIHQIKCYRAA